MNSIDRRDFLKLAAGAAAATGLGLHSETAAAAARIHDAAAPSAQKPAVDRPNILYILTDQLTARALSCYSGTGIDTPHIDSLAANGTLLTSSFTNSGVCTPSRAAFMTGHYAFQTGASANHQPMDRAPAGTIADVCREAGYATSYLGKWHLSGRPKPGKAIDGKITNSGFEDTSLMWNRGHWKTVAATNGGRDYTLSAKVGRRDYTTRVLSREARKRMQPGGKPWMCVVSFPDPHPPLPVCPPFNRMYKNDSLLPSGWNTPEGWDMPIGQLPLYLRRSGLTDNLDRRRKRLESYARPYLGMVKLIDNQVGQMINHLRVTKQLDDTIIMFSTDHGELLGEYGSFGKGPPLPGTYRLPMIWSGPGIARQQRSEVVSAIDLHPTITELVGAPPRATMGTSYANMLRGGAYGGEGKAFFHGTSPRTGRDTIGVITQDWFVGLTRQRGTAVQNRATGEMTFTPTNPNNPAAPRNAIADLRDHVRLMKRTQPDFWLGHGEWLL